MEELTWKEKVKAYLLERAKVAPKLILITVVSSVVLSIGYYVVMALI